MSKIDEMWDDLVNRASRVFRNKRDLTFAEVKKAAERLLTSEQEKLLMVLVTGLLEKLGAKLLKAIVEHAEKLGYKLEWPQAPDRLKGN